MFKEYNSKNYIFHYHINSKAEKDIEEIARSQEISFKYICDILNVEFNDKIHYWLCENPEEVGKLYGDNKPCSGLAVEPNLVYAVYNERLQCIGFHEDAHLISYKINTPNSCFLREGLAMFFDRVWWRIDNCIWTSFYIENNMMPSIVSMLKDDYFYKIDCKVSYPIAGAFTLYLIIRYGKEKYLKFYKCKDNNFEEAVKKNFSKSLIDLESEFIEYTKMFKYDENIKQRIKQLLDKLEKLF